MSYTGDFIFNLPKYSSDILKFNLNSTQFQIQLWLRLALYPAYPATHPATQPASYRDFSYWECF